MIQKSISTLSAVLVLALAHVGCCLLPLVALASSSIPFFSFLSEYQDVVAFFQLGMLAYLGFHLSRHYTGKERFHSSLERLTYHLGLVFTVLSLVVGHFEPFHTENQRIAQQQFQFFKTHRRTVLGFTGTFDAGSIKKEITLVKGIRSCRQVALPEAPPTKGSTIGFSITYQTEQVSLEQLIEAFRQKGHRVWVQE
ncbi:hypothetical protein CLV98_101667 [Dyadobacter jejuensis]|uniref:Uncharacterized protein n=1 Tax=Dyadobacter jejuensis TaxID=1082580 RepID=A0A316AS11_9BACT|nr:hypothetical protein [Dyadobacter jejuensis]PWJ60483.1 hypothetical protein CLV98_101667 [Dyadobacter jejuensis]